MEISYLITDSNITLNYANQTHILTRTDTYADRVIEALRNKNFEAVPAMISAAKRIEKFSDGRFVVQDGEILIDGILTSPVVAKKIKQFADNQLQYQPLIEFQKKLNENPSQRSVEQLYTFLEKNNHPITEDGDFIAYKKIRQSYLDIHSNSMDNRPGTVVEMDRKDVNDDPNITCSFGLHVSNWDYAYNHFGSKEDLLIECSVNPKDVCSVPIDYNNSKMRVCKYKVLGIVDKENSDMPLRVLDQGV